MVVESLTTLSFRNLADARIELGPGVTLLHGPNGAGKTNVLEALYFALAGRSCRTRADREAIRFGEPLARVEAALATDERRVLLAAVERSGGRRHLLDGNPLTGPALGERPAVAVFMPDRLSLVKGPPALRRAHLDAFAAALRPASGASRRRYARALGQRNALLGRARRGQAGADQLDAWDAELAAAGAELISDRRAALEALEARFTAAAAELGLGAAATIRYRPRSAAATAAELRRELGERRGADLARGHSTHGPHLDELAIERDGRPLRRFGSQGEQRAALLALLFAERDALLADRRSPPLLLLDDVTSELDPERRELLCQRLAAGGQALVTATEASHLPASCERHEIAVRDGAAIAASQPARQAAAA